MLLPRSRAGKITVVVLAVFTIAMNPPVILLVDAPVVVAGTNLLYLWTALWGIFISLVFIWAAWRDAFALTEDQIPPELRDTNDVMTTATRTDEERTTERL